MNVPADESAFRADINGLRALAVVRVSPLPSVVEFNSSVKSAIGTDIVDILATVTDARGKVPIFTPNGRFITYDTNHLTRAGAAFVGARLFARYPVLKPPAG